MKLLLKLITTLFPWPLRRWALQKWFGFELHPTAYIGWAWVFPKKLKMGAGAYIDHFTVAINLDSMTLEEKATIGRNNWITGFPLGNDTAHFKHQADRQPALVVGKGAAITKNHHLDCTNLLTIGAFSTVAGYHSQFLTHSINLLENRQDSAPIHIGDYSFVGTNVVVLGGASLPAHSVLGAKSLLNKPFIEEWRLYGGVPARPLNDIPHTAKYFTRQEGFVY